MTLLSIVLPVYKVQGYLRQCLDSLLDQSFTDIEVDRGRRRLAGPQRRRSSPSTPPAIPGSGWSRLPENVGLGRARNAGLDQATGEYVWFVDSDDWLAAGALAAVADRLRGDRAGRAARRPRPGALGRPGRRRSAMPRLPGRRRPATFTARGVAARC